MGTSSAFQNLIYSIGSNPKIIAWLSILGAVFGIASILFHIVKILRRRPRLKITLSDSLSSYYFKTTNGKVQNFRTHACAVLSLSITNCTSLPVSIDSIHGLSSKLKYTVMHNPEFTEIRTKVTVQGQRAFFDTASPAKLPLRIDPFDTVFVGIRFVYFNDFIDDDSTNVTFKLIVRTARRVFKPKISIKEIDLFLNSRKI